MYVLLWAGQPIAVAARFERCAEQMSLYTPNQQAQMFIVRVELLT